MEQDQDQLICAVTLQGLQDPTGKYRIHAGGYWEELPTAAKETPELLRKALLDVKANWADDNQFGIIQQFLEMLALMQKLAQDKENR